ncbi:MULTISPECIES: hypothetical protein [Kitasatospora]|uniref:Uncharacterized protein n=1 Tax=Kitasatospora cathayae TaxID=3004092 RepID=A0ABY7QAC0_9ACTN|nr:hypothetical protein [Kitasatospora sp. HUAS 3-15]WBP89603.1 hypothetical protein O1G21_29670 [Kitasatospora sp. HUAS 3-15]
MTDPLPTSAFHAPDPAPSITDRRIGALDVHATDPGVRRLREWAHAGVGRGPG